MEIIDDSKATNPAAAKTAIELTRGPLIWIAGGRDKGTDFSDLALVAQTRAREAILYGEAAEKIGSALKDKISGLNVKIRDLEDKNANLEVTMNFVSGHK